MEDISKFTGNFKGPHALKRTVWYKGNICCPIDTEIMLLTWKSSPLNFTSEV